MRLAGRIAAAAAVLDDFSRRRVPLKTALADWARGARYAGAKDRAWISGLCLDALRKRNSLAHAMQADNGRALALATLYFTWQLPLDELEQAAAEQPHGIGALTSAEKNSLTTLPAPMGDAAIDADIPDWLCEELERSFGSDLIEECQALTHRAPLDLRVNTLRSTPAAALDALQQLGAAPAPLLRNALRIPPASAEQRAPSVDVLPVYLEGDVEIQDLGSQLVAAAASDISGLRVLDFCAGGGGKTLALAAQMENRGELYAWDRDARRMRDLYARARRAGVDNLTVRNPAAGDDLQDLEGQMDLVLVDAPCSGTGVWRRQPDAKWRLRSKQLQTRIAEQNSVLREALRYVKAGGRLVYATCSILKLENDDRVAQLLKDEPGLSLLSAREALLASGLLADDAQTILQCCQTDTGLLFSPARSDSDGLFVAVISKS